MTTNQNPSTAPDTTDDVEGHERLSGGFDPNNDTQTADEADDVEGNSARGRFRTAEQATKDMPAEGDDTDGNLYKHD